MKGNMAEALIYQDSPFDQYLRDSSLEEDVLAMPGREPATQIGNSSSGTDLNEPSIVTAQGARIGIWDWLRCMSQALTPTKALLDESKTTEPPEHLSERLKYLICSSYLLTPEHSSSLYDTLPTPPLESSEAVGMSPSPTTVHDVRRTLTQPLALSFSAFVISIIICATIALGWFAPRLYLILATLLAATGCYHPNSLQTGLAQLTGSPTKTLEELEKTQTALLPRVQSLIASSQAVDIRVSRALTAIKEVECVSMGFSVSESLPPVSRLELANFCFGSSPTASTFEVGPGASPGLSAASVKSPHNSPLKARRLRSVVASVLARTESACQEATRRLEHGLMKLADSSVSMGGSEPKSDTLTALRDMYGCGDTNFEQNRVTPRVLTDQDKRRSWRQSQASTELRSENPISPDNRRRSFHQVTDLGLLDLSNSPSQRAAKRATWQPSASSTPTVPVGRSASARAALGSPLSTRKPRRRSGPRLTITGSSLPPASEPHSHDATTSNPQYSGWDNTNPTSAGLHESGLSPHVYPVFGSSAPSSPTSPEKSGSSPQRDAFIAAGAHHPSAHSDESLGLSLGVLKQTFDRVHLNRKRMLCCLLALDFDRGDPGRARLDFPVWLDIQAVISSLVNELAVLGQQIEDGMRQSFGPGSWDSALRSRPATPSPSRDPAEDPRGFAPPPTPGRAEMKAMGEFSARVQDMFLSLRTITAKLNMCTTDLHAPPVPGSESRRLQLVHESIRNDLETLARAWDTNRLTLGRLLHAETDRSPTPDARAPNPEHGWTGHAITSTTESQSGSPPSARTSSVFSTEVKTPADGSDGTTHSMSAALIETLEATDPIHLPAPGLEQVFEAVADSAGTPSPQKMTRDERIQLMKQQRKAKDPYVPRPVDETGLVVAELKNVISVLKTRRGATQQPGTERVDEVQTI